MDIYYPRTTIVSHGKVHEFLHPSKGQSGEPTEESVRWLIELRGEMILVETRYSVVTRYRQLLINSAVVAEFPESEPVVDFKLGRTNVRMMFNSQSANDDDAYDLALDGAHFKDLPKALPSPIPARRGCGAMIFGEPKALGSAPLRPRTLVPLPLAQPPSAPPSVCGPPGTLAPYHERQMDDNERHHKLRRGQQDQQQQQQMYTRSAVQQTSAGFASSQDRDVHDPVMVHSLADLCGGSLEFAQPSRQQEQPPEPPTKIQRSNSFFREEEGGTGVDSFSSHSERWDMDRVVRARVKPPAPGSKLAKSLVARFGIHGAGSLLGAEGRQRSWMSETDYSSSDEMDEEDEEDEEGAFDHHAVPVLKLERCKSEGGAPSCDDLGFSFASFRSLSTSDFCTRKDLTIVPPPVTDEVLAESRSVQETNMRVDAYRVKTTRLYKCTD